MGCLAGSAFSIPLASTTVSPTLTWQAYKERLTPNTAGMKFDKPWSRLHVPTACTLRPNIWFGPTKTQKLPLTDAFGPRNWNLICNCQAHYVWIRISQISQSEANFLAWADLPHNHLHLCITRTYCSIKLGLTICFTSLFLAHYPHVLYLWDFSRKTIMSFFRWWVTQMCTSCNPLYLHLASAICV